MAITSDGIQTDGDFRLFSENNAVIIDGDGIKIYGDESTDAIQVFNANNEQTFSLDSEGNVILSGSVVGSRFYGDGLNSAYIKIGVGGNSNLGDLGVFRGGESVNSHPVFSVYDNLTRIDLRIGNGNASPISFLGVGVNGETIYAEGDTWNFSNVSVIGLVGYATNTSVETVVANAIADHIANYH